MDFLKRRKILGKTRKNYKTIGKIKLEQKNNNNKNDKRKKDSSIN